MNERSGLTLAEAGITLCVLAVAVLVLLPLLGRRREESARIPCRNHLNQLAKGMFTYLNEHGDNRFYPCPLGRGAKATDYNGAEWLASLYWTGVVIDPGVFVCPSSRDTNRGGRDLGASSAVPGRFGSETVSYAAMHYRSLTNEAGRPRPGAIPDDFAPNEAMASDDTQGAINHGTRDSGGMGVLFFDSHVEFKTNTEVDIERGVGATAPRGEPQPLLWRLRN